MVEPESDSRKSVKTPGLPTATDCLGTAAAGAPLAQERAEAGPRPDADASGPLTSTSDTLRGDLAIGAPAGEYIVTGLVARGGCGAVYHARHARLDRLAAVKVLHAPLAVLPKMVERFKREVEVVGMLRHPNIVDIYEVGALADRRPFYAMELLSGRTLAAVIEEEGRMSPREVMEVIEPVCAALVAAHAAGVIHRDVKASNVMVDSAGQGSVKLLDFGIAKLIGPPDNSSSHVSLTTEGRQVGTLTIMAPEQLLGGPVDGRIDIYALGVLIYRLLTGRLPFDGKNALTLAEQHMNAPPPRPSLRAPLSPAMDAVVLRCMEKRPERRYPSVEELADALRAAVLGGRGGARTAGGPALGVGIYLEILMPPDGIDDALGDALGDDISDILDLAEEALSSAGYAIAFSTGNSVLGVRALPEDPAEGAGARADALATALALHERVAARPGADPRARPKICVHVDGIALRSGAEVAVTGGALVRANAWAPIGDVPAVCATAPAAEGVTGFDLAPIAASPASPLGSPAHPRPALISVARRAAS